jgi:hypothetical protein
MPITSDNAYIMTFSKGSRTRTMHLTSGYGQIADTAFGKKCSQNAIATFQALEHPYNGQDYFVFLLGEDTN